MARIHIKASLKAFGGLEQFIAALAAAAGLTPTDITVEGKDEKRPFNFVTVTDENSAKVLAADVTNAAGEKVAINPAIAKEPKPQAETPKAKPTAPAIPQGPVKVKPPPVQRTVTPPPSKGQATTVITRPAQPDSAELIQLRDKNRELKGRVHQFEERARQLESAKRKIAWLGGERVKYFLAQNAVTLLLGREVAKDGTLLVTERDTSIFVDTVEKAFHTLAHVRYYMDAHGMKAERIGFEKSLETSRTDDAADAKKASDPARATLADGQKAKEKDRGHKERKAKEARNAPPTTEAPAPVPPPSTETTQQVAQQ